MSISLHENFAQYSYTAWKQDVLFYTGLKILLILCESLNVEKENKMIIDVSVIWQG